MHHDIFVICIGLIGVGESLKFDKFFTDSWKIKMNNLEIAMQIFARETQKPQLTFLGVM